MKNFGFWRSSGIVLIFRGFVVIFAKSVNALKLQLNFGKTAGFCHYASVKDLFNPVSF